MPAEFVPARLRIRLVLAALSGALAVTAFAPFGLFWLMPGCLAVLFLLWQRAANGREAALTGFVWGAGLFLIGVSWVYVSLATFGGMPWWLAGPATLGFCLLLALFPALAGLLFKRWQPAGGLAQACLFAALMTLADWSRTWVLTGFPWLLVGYSQSDPSPLNGFAPLLGVHGIGFLVLFTAALLPRWKIGVPLLLGLALAGAGLTRMNWTAPAGAPVSVALVQGNVPQEMKFRPEAFVRTLALYRDLIEHHPARLTVLPETAIPAFIDQLPPEYVEELRGLARREQGDIVLGIVLGDSQRYWNGALSLGTAPVQTYRKSHLVPFGETIPAGFAWFMAMADIPMSSFAPGEALQPPLRVAGQALAVDICYEDVFGEDIRHSAAAAGILVNLSNTAWFGDSLAQPQHLQIARMRAAETGRPMLRATNTGMTAVIAPGGALQAVLPPFTTAVLRAEVTPHEGETPYVRWGNAPVLIALAALLAGIALRRRLQRD